MIRGGHQLPSLAILVAGGLIGLAAIAAAATDQPQQPASALESPIVTLEPVASGFEEPLLLVGAGDGSGDRYVVEKRGTIMRLNPDGTTQPEPFLDISDHVLDNYERGMLSLAFHPDYESNGRFFVAYSREADGATALSEFTRPTATADQSAGEPQASPEPVERSERTLLVVPPLFTTHKGGMVAFDAKGMLLFSVGDGGSLGDPYRMALDTSSLLGKLLRIDVDRGWPYALPPDNGFAGVAGAHPEIHAIGLRNPWRFSVDSKTGDVYIGDVGDSSWEEIDVLPVGRRGVSFGWSDMEGDGCFGGRACNPDDHVLPAITYPHVDGDTGHCAVIGGYAYRGTRGSLPDGLYVYADYCSGTIWGADAADLHNGAAAPIELGHVDGAYGQVLSFGQDDAGELYVTTSGGSILHLRAGAASNDG